MKKNLLFLLSSILASHAFADTSESCSDYTYDECCIPECADNCCSWGITPYVDFLWWRAGGCNLAYGEITSTQTDDPPVSRSTSDQRELEFCPEWNPGVRVGLAKEFSCNGVGFFGEWTWYQTTDRDKIKFLGTDVDTSTLGFNSSFSTSISSISSLTLNSKFRFRINRVDVGVFKSCCFCDCFLIKPYLAFTYAYFNENLKFKANGVSNTTTEIAQKVLDYKNKTTFCAYGGTLGLMGNWDLSCGFSLGFDINFTPVGGKYKIDETEFLSTMEQAPAQLDAQLTRTFKFEGKDGRLFSKIQAGLEYETCFCECYFFKAMLGLEYQVYLDQTNWLLERTPPDLVCIDEQAHSFNVGGLVARVAFSF